MGFGLNGSQEFTAAGSDPPALDAFYAITALEDGTSVTVDYTDLLGDQLTDEVRARDKGETIYGHMTNVRVTAGSIEAYRIYPINALS